ncbi:MAG TPA: helix-turn-helix domain-containing protein [Candidatus Paceibacterota bacterium]
MKSETVKSQALHLRASGHSYSYISDKTGISKSTLSDWLTRIPYIPNQETIARIGKARAASGAAKHKIKVESLTRAALLAKDDIGTISRRDLFMLGLGLYIGEGTKSGNIIRVINANPHVIRLAMVWFKKICNLTNSNFRLRLHIYPDNNEKDCIKYWSKITGLPTRNFQKTQIDLRKDKKMAKRGKLPYGTAHLHIKSNGVEKFGVFLARRIQAWTDIVLRV